MNENAVKNYATWARRELMTEVGRRCALYGISDDKDCPYDAESVGGRVLSSEERRMRRELVGEAKRGMPALVERAAYTWFNRMLAIRFMECNDRLPSQTRMFSAPDGSFAPQALKEALSVEIDGIDRQRVASLVQGGDDEALFRYLLLLQCDELADCMPAVFDKVGEDPLVLLLPDGLLRSEGVIGKLVTDISEDDWRDGVQIVGWMYQFYIIEKKDEFFASKRKASAEDIPAATQLFTPGWIVQYLVQNSLGRLWMLNRPSSRLAERMEYFIVPDADAHEEFQHVSSPEEITLIDPACGSGHILVYAFDLLAAIYEECGYSRRDIPRLILEENLTGVEIDRRAGALASFALTMKACEYDSRFLRRGVRPRVSVLEKVELEQEHIDAINAVRTAVTKNGEPFLLDRVDLLNALAHLDEVGSLFVPTDIDMAALHAAFRGLEQTQGLFSMGARGLIKEAIKELMPLFTEYSIVAANPPYLANMDTWLSLWVKENYPDERSDLCGCFINRSLRFVVKTGYISVITADTCMHLSSFEEMRLMIYDNATIISLIDTRGTNAHPDVFDANAGWVLNKASNPDFLGDYFQLDQPISEKSRALKNALRHDSGGKRFKARPRKFMLLPNNPVAYWVKSSVFDAFNNGEPLSRFATPKKGLTTSKDEVFLRLWHEVSAGRSSLNERNENAVWVPLNKGGSFRRWYGNNEYVIEWADNGKKLRDFDKSVIRNEDYYFRESITWNDITTGIPSLRWKSSAHVFNDAGPSIFSTDSRLLSYLLGFGNSTVMGVLAKMIAPTIHFTVGQMSQAPIIMGCASEREEIDRRVCDSISLAKSDWDSFETSWDFLSHPLVGWSYQLWDVTSIGASMHYFYGYHPEVGSPLELCYMLWQGQCRERFGQLKSNEEELNRIFVRIYGMEGEVPVEVPDDKVSVRLADKTRDVKSLISYAVGCMLGRYSLDIEGLVLANQGDGLAEYLTKVPEPTFMPDDDGIIPITDTEYFHDDATGFFVDFVRTVYGEESLEENLAFVADALGGTGTPRETIREYFMNGFFADHCKIYQKRPIYWLFDSGKKGGFRALVYMHRYKPDLLAKLRTDYVHEQQDRYRTQIEHIDDAMEAADRRQQAELKKRRKKLVEQLAEISVFEEKVHHLADQMIEIDLDDGVKVNYAKFQDVLAKIK